jgi:hypothetical protein
MAGPSGVAGVWWQMCGLCLSTGTVSWPVLEEVAVKSGSLL